MRLTFDADAYRIEVELGLHAESTEKILRGRAVCTRMIEESRIDIEVCDAILAERGQGADAPQIVKFPER